MAGMIAAGHSMGGMHMGGMHMARTHMGATTAHRAATTHAMGGMRMGPEPPINLHTLLTDWQTGIFPIGVGVVALLIAGWYLFAVGNLAGRGRQWSRWRTVSFLAGLVSVELAIGSSVASLSMYTFTAHVIQHLGLMIVAPPFLALGAPMTLILQTSQRPTKRRVLKALHSRVFGVVRHQVPVFFLYYLSMYAFFLTPALGYAMGHMWLMDLINLGFLAGATLFWWPMVGIDPIPGGGMSPGFKILNLLIGIPVESFLGIALLMATTPVASIYSLETTHTGGGVLWAASEVATLAALLPVYRQWTKADARAAKRIDARLDAGETIAPRAVEGQGMAATLRSLRRG
jgi:putative membrane protein